MEFVWQSSGGAGRKRTSQACPKCRARKKRCYHLENSDTTETPRTEVDNGRAEAAGPEGPSESATRESSPVPIRISEYNPESVLEDLSKSPESLPGMRGQQKSGFTGPSPASSSDAATAQSPLTAQRDSRRLMWYKKHRHRRTAPKISEHYRRYLEEVGAFLELPAATTGGLLPIYLSMLDELIPVVDGSSILRDYSNGHASIYLIRAMCLVVCKSKQAAPFLRTKEDGPLLQPMAFATKMMEGLDAAIKADLEPDRVTKVQVLALMHLHNDGLAGVDRSSGNLSQAINEAWALSLHWNIPLNADQANTDYLWWSLRNFDRLNKPVMGAAPFIIDDSDIGVRRIDPREGDYRSQLMAVSIALGDLLVVATKVYKATSTATVDGCETFPSLAEITYGTMFDRFHKAHRAYLEIWYHLAATLSCRYSGPDTSQYSRRLASADRILQILCDGGFVDLPPLPLVPYAMSMATTTIYRALCDGQRDLEYSQRELGRCCETLDSLSKDWTTARGIAKLARRLWKIVNKTWESEKQARSTTSSSPITTRGRASFEGSSGDARVHGNMPSFQFQPPQPSVLTGDGGAAGPLGMMQNQGTPLFHLDDAYFDLFDYGMPNVFRDPATWDFLHASPEENWAGSQR